jgi:deazaflavin-dependent oxidoreductase (nitroreductase family)
VNDWNTRIIEEFRANGGKVGAGFEGAPLLLLTTTGAKSQNRRVNPMMYLRDGDTLYVFASKAGGPTNPDWYHNLVAHPEVTVEIGTETHRAVARVTEGEEHDRTYARQSELYPVFADYQQRTNRVIPVIALEGIPA